MLKRYPATYNCSDLYTSVWADQCCPDGAAAQVSFDAQWSADNFVKFAVLPFRDRYNVPIFVNQWSVVHGVPGTAGRYGNLHMIGTVTLSRA